MVASYEEILNLARLMLEAAKKEEWDELTALEEKRFVLLETLMAADKGDWADARLNARKSELIQNVLTCDVETRELAEAWMVELRQIIDSVGTEKKLNDFYAA